MNDLMDNLARILATPMPRRKAFKLFGGALAAAAFAVTGSRPASAATTIPKCQKGQVNCGPTKVCCNKGWYVCGGTCVQQKIASQQCSAKC